MLFITAILFPIQLIFVQPAASGMVLGVSGSHVSQVYTRLQVFKYHVGPYGARARPMWPLQDKLKPDPALHAHNGVLGCMSLAQGGPHATLPGATLDDIPVHAAQPLSVGQAHRPMLLWARVRQSCWLVGRA